MVIHINYNNRLTVNYNNWLTPFNKDMLVVYDIFEKSGMKPLIVYNKKLDKGLRLKLHNSRRSVKSAKELDFSKIKQDVVIILHNEIFQDFSEMDLLISEAEKYNKILILQIDFDVESEYVVYAHHKLAFDDSENINKLKSFQREFILSKILPSELDF